MITPAYSPTATERVLPRLALDFTTGILDSRVTVTRALNTATRVNSSGYIENVNADLPRFDYDPVTLAPKGLLIEETRTNSKTYSEDLNSAAILLVNASVSSDAAISPRNTLNADILVENTATAGHGVDFFTPVAGTTYSLSFYAKPSGRSRLQFSGGGFAGQGFAATFDFANGTMAINTGNKASIVPAGNGYYRCSLSFTASNTINFNLTLANNSNVVAYQGDGTSGAIIWGLQVEVGAFATSYIPTTTTSLTRNFDYVTMTGTNFSSWFNASEGSIYSEFVPYEVAGDVSWSFGSAYANSICGQIANNLQFFIVNGNVVQVSLDGGSCTANAINKSLAAYKANNSALSVGGGAVVSTASGSIPTVTKLVLGSLDTVAAAVMNGHYRKFNYYNLRVTDAEVRAFSK